MNKFILTGIYYIDIIINMHMKCHKFEFKTCISIVDLETANLNLKRVFLLLI